MSSGSLTTSTRITFVLSLLKEWDEVQRHLRANGVPVTVYPTPGSIIKYLNIEGQHHKALEDTQVYSVFKRIRKYLVPAGFFDFHRPQYIPTKLFDSTEPEKMAELTTRIAKACQGKHTRPSEIVKRELKAQAIQSDISERSLELLKPKENLSEELMTVLRSMSDVIQEVHIVFKTRL